MPRCTEYVMTVTHKRMQRGHVMEERRHLIMSADNKRCWTLCGDLLANGTVSADFKSAPLDTVTCHKCQRLHFDAKRRCKPGGPFFHELDGNKS